MMLKGIALPVFYNSDDCELLDELELDYPLIRCDIKEVIFYNIDNIKPYLDENDNDHEYCSITSGNHRFISPLDLTKIRNMLDVHQLLMISKSFS